MTIPVDNLKIPELAVYASANEAQLKHIREPAPGLFIAETVNVVQRALRAGFTAESMLIDERYLREQDREPAAEILRTVGEIPVYTAPLEVISRISGFRQSHGFLCAFRRKALPALSDVLAGAKRIAVLEDVENPTNVGAIFRSAAALGIDAAVLTRGSADPLYRRASRVSMGGVFRVPWTFTGTKYGGWPEPALTQLHAAGFRTAAMALTGRAITPDEPDLRREEKLAILLGNEDCGLRPETLALCSDRIRIPMRNEMDSLNVAAAAAAAFWALC